MHACTTQSRHPDSLNGSTDADAQTDVHNTPKVHTTKSRSIVDLAVYGVAEHAHRGDGQV